MSDLTESLRMFQAAAGKSKLHDLLRDSLEPDEAGNKAKAELAKTLDGRDSRDAVLDFLKAMKQANVSVAEAIVMMTRM